MPDTRATFQEKCLNKDCTVKFRFGRPYCRQLCTNCYMTAYNLVAKNYVTWKYLEDTGKCGPSTRIRAELGFRGKWFLGEGRQEAKNK